MRISAKLDTAATRKHLEAARLQIRKAALQSAQEAARECVRLLQHDQTGKLEEGVDNRLRAVFIPVTLVGRRRITKVFGKTPKKPVYAKTKEFWPNLDPIYHARVVRAQKTYQGRKRFHVDEQKLDGLFNRLMAKAKARGPHRYTIRVRHVSTGYIVEVLRLNARSNYRPSNREQRAVVIAAQKFKRLSEENLTRALEQAAL